MANQQSHNKKELEKRRLQKKKEKEERKEQRKAEPKRSFEDMLAYVDENGNISSTPPDLQKKKVINEADVVLGSRNVGGHITATGRRTGKVLFFNKSKGFGFIKDTETQESVFVHINSLETEINEQDLVSFETENGAKGPVAVQVRREK
jgi:cold shock CspA family protein